MKNFIRREILLRIIKWTPRKKQLKGGWIHRLLGDRIFIPSLWTFSPKPVAAGLALGTFVAFTPTFPLQMILATMLAYWFKVNIPAAIIGCWITNPITMPIIYPLEYMFGKWLSSVFNLPDISTFPQMVDETESMIEIMEIPKHKAFFQNIMMKVKDLVLGSLIFAFVSSIAVYGIFYPIMLKFSKRASLLQIIRKRRTEKLKLIKKENDS
ncbi:MAG: DUF2062 domain-containing protein [Fibrobacteria bacterium]|nr:DUF2062 domain-containing protein [Fibrobacteria bacterium]